MKNTALFVASTLVLSACAIIPPAKEPAPPQQADYRAVGTEPGWAVTISGNTIEYLGDYGQTKIITPHPAPRTTFNGHRYEAKTEAHSLVVDVTHGKCSDGMSDRIYADKVMVIADGKTVNGCGGAILPPSELAGSNWRIERIAGA
ncbi:MAG: COG3650 family protein, partial [Sphingomonadaceae bacterium]